MQKSNPKVLFTMFQWCASGRRKQLKLFNSRLGHQNKCWQSEIWRFNVQNLVPWQRCAYGSVLLCYGHIKTCRSYCFILATGLSPFHTCTATMKLNVTPEELQVWTWMSGSLGPSSSLVQSVCNDLMEPVWAAQVNALRIHSDHVDDVFTDCSCLMLFSACLYINFHYFYKNM